MKRAWFAVIFLIIVGLLCTGEQYFLHRFCHTLNAKIDYAIACCDNEDSRQAQYAIEDVQQYWAKHNDLLFVTSAHGGINELGVQIRALDADNKEVKNELKHTKALNTIYFENEKISFANIF